MASVVFAASVAKALVAVVSVYGPVPSSSSPSPLMAPDWVVAPALSVRLPEMEDVERMIALISSTDTLFAVLTAKVPKLLAAFVRVMLLAAVPVRLVVPGTMRALVWVMVSAVTVRLRVAERVSAAGGTEVDAVACAAFTVDHEVCVEGSIQSLDTDDVIATAAEDGDGGCQVVVHGLDFDRVNVASTSNGD
jgi:hypothetical protein